jgi:hypothetical protein
VPDPWCMRSDRARRLRRVHMLRARQRAKLGTDARLHEATDAKPGSAGGLGGVAEVAVDGGPDDAELAAIWATVYLRRPSGLVSSYMLRANCTCREPSFGFCPPVRPRAPAAAKPSMVRSDIRRLCGHPPFPVLAGLTGGAAYGCMASQAVRR